MATRLATQRTNLITVTPVTSQQANTATATVQVVTESGEIATGDSTNEQAATATIIPASELAEATASIVKANNEDSAAAAAASATVAANALTLQQVIRQVCTKVS